MLREFEFGVEPVPGGGDVRRDGFASGLSFVGFGETKQVGGRSEGRNSLNGELRSIFGGDLPGPQSSLPALRVPLDDGASVKRHPAKLARSERREGASTVPLDTAGDPSGWVVV